MAVFAVIVRFDKGQSIAAAITTRGPLVRAAIDELGANQVIDMSYDGSMIAWLVKCDLHPQQIAAHLESPRSGGGSGITHLDAVTVVRTDKVALRNKHRLAGWVEDHLTFSL